MSPNRESNESDADVATLGIGQMPTTVTNAVANRLREEIRSGELAPGTRLRQAHVAADYGVSTTPVREAFAALEREGLLQSIAHRGVVVFQPSTKDLHEIYEIRVPLEALATELGAARLSDQDLKKLAKIAKAMVAANRKKDWVTSGEMNDEFHLEIYRHAGRPRLLKLITDLRASSRAYIGLFPKLIGRVKEVEREHQEIYDACAARKPKKAAKAMVQHLTYTADAIAETLDSDD